MVVPVFLALKIGTLAAGAALSDGLVFYTPYEGTLQNVVLGQEAASSVTGAASLTNAARFGSGALGLNGSSAQDAGVQYDDSNNNFDLGSGDFSACAWVVLSNVTNRQQIITMNRSGTSTDLQLRVDQGYVRAFFYGGDADRTLDMAVLLKPRDWDGRWMHIAFVCRRSEGGCLYINGEFRGALSRTSTGYASTTTDICTGYYGSIPGRSMQNARVDEVAVWTRALSSDEIICLQDNPVVRGSTGLSVFLKSRKPILNPVDILERIYPDRAPPTDNSTFNVPRGGNAFFQFALTAGAALQGETLSFSVDTLQTSGGLPLAGTGTVHVLKPVLVEANTTACAHSGVGIVPPPGLLDALVREAPFEVYEVLSDDTELEPDGRAFYSIVARVQVDTNAVPGIYQGVLRVADGVGTLAAAPFEMQVFPAVLPAQRALDATHWLWPEPENLTTGTVPAWWSDEHWALLEAAGKTLYGYGDTSMFTPLLFGGHPLIETTLNPDGSLSFDFSKITRWMELFSEIGFSRFQGHQIGGGGTPAPATAGGSRVLYAVDQDGISHMIGTTMEEWMGSVLPAFYDSLYNHLTTSGWFGLYVQSLCDEPRTESLAAYTELASLTRLHMPGITILDALHRLYSDYGEQMDVPAFWFGYVYVSAWPSYVAGRVQQGRMHWIYNACSPQAPHPNRHLDYPLACNRLFPWLADYCRGTGYLNWAANNYRGADPYLTSIGPLPDGSQNPGHPPGDNWFFYKTDGGMLPSMRMVSFLIGKEDFELLALLRQTNMATANDISDRIVQQVILDYSDNNVRSYYVRAPEPYHKARLLLLEALEGQVQ